MRTNPNIGYSSLNVDSSGLNGVLYSVQIDADGGKSKYGNVRAKYGMGHCGAQCIHNLKFINGE